MYHVCKVYFIVFHTSTHTHNQSLGLFKILEYGAMYKCKKLMSFQHVKPKRGRRESAQKAPRSTRFRKLCCLVLILCFYCYCNQKCNLLISLRTQLPFFFMSRIQFFRRNYASITEEKSNLLHTPERMEIRLWSA